MESTDRLSVLALRLGLAVPFLYFGIQLAAAPFYPGYSFLSRDASTLGSAGSTHPAIFDDGAMLLGVVTLLSAWGFLRGLRACGASVAMACLASLAVFSSGLGSINASLFPLPDPRHSSGLLSAAASGTFLLPLLLPVALWKLLSRGQGKIYFIANLLAIIPLAVVMSSLIQRWGMNSGVDLSGYQYFLNHYHGLLQRIIAAIIFGPVGVTAWILLRRISLT